MKNAKTFGESVLNAMYANPDTVNNSCICYACEILSWYYAGIMENRIKRFVPGSEDAKECRKLMRHYEMQASDFHDRFFELQGEYQHSLKGKMNRIEAYRKARTVFEIKRRIIESHFDKDNGIFVFNNISFG